MPALPTLTINNTEVWNRLLVIFDNDPAKYLAWLKDKLRDEVERRELKLLFDEMEAHAAARRAELRNFLDSAT